MPSLYNYAERGNLAEVQRLLNAGANVNATKTNGETPLYIAVFKGRTKIVQLLLAVPGININAAKTNDGATPLFVAAFKGHKEIVQLLLSAPGININAARTDGVTPLYFAAVCGHESIVFLLLELGADTSLISYGGKSVWDYAKESTFKEKINEMILEYGYISDEPLTCEELYERELAKSEMIPWKKVKCFA